MKSEQSTCDQVISTLRGVKRDFDLHYRRLLREYELSGPQIIVFKTIQAQEMRPISEVARDFHLSHATVTGIVDRLEEKALLQRIQSNKDRREVHNSLTDEGFATVSRSPAPLHEKFKSDSTALDR